MNILRHNIVTIFLTLVVSAATSLNYYLTQMHCDQYQDAMRRNEMIGRAQELLAEKDRQYEKLSCILMHEAVRAAKYEDDSINARVAIGGLKTQIGFMTHVMSMMNQHMEECHRLMKERGIQPPKTGPTPAEPPCPPRVNTKKEDRTA